MTAAAPGESHSDNSPYREWARITEGIRRGDPEAIAEFARTYAGGARLICRRRLGAVRTEKILDDALAGVASEVRLGWIRTPRDFVFFLHELCTHQDGSAADVDTPAEVARARVSSAALESILGRFTRAEAAAVRAYYLDRRPFEEALGEAGLKPEDGARLRARLRLAFESQAVPKPVRSESPQFDGLGWERSSVAP
ncbi:MAG: hypothetical protein R2729_31690 [Bryobacteraceae bacterium]